jgi:hypothetical protein
LFALIVFFASSCRTEQNQKEPTNPQALFSEQSHDKLMKLFMDNIQYPTEARNQGITGRFFIIIDMEKGGKINNIAVNDTDKSINIPLISFNEVTVIGKPNSEELLNTSRSDYVTKDLKILEDEGVRVAKVIESLNLPEWQNNSMQFAISLNFRLTKD